MKRKQSQYVDEDDREIILVPVYSDVLSCAELVLEMVELLQHLLLCFQLNFEFLWLLVRAQPPRRQRLDRAQRHRQAQQPQQRALSPQATTSSWMAAIRT